MSLYTNNQSLIHKVSNSLELVMSLHSASRRDATLGSKPNTPNHVLRISERCENAGRTGPSPTKRCISPRCENAGRTGPSPTKRCISPRCNRIVLIAVMCFPHHNQNISNKSDYMAG